MVAARGAHRDSGKGPAELLGGAPCADDTRPQPRCPAGHAVPVRGTAPAPAAGQIARVRCLERSRTVPAPGRGTAPLAGEAGRVAAPGHLHQHRSALQPLPHGLPGHAGQPRGPGRLVPCQVLVADRTDQWRGGAHLLPVGGQRQRPAALDQLGGLHRAARAAQQERAGLVGGAEFQHLTDVREGGVLVAVAGVAVVPDGDQSEVLHGGEHRGPRPDDGLHRASAHGEPLAVPLLGPGLGGQQRMPAGTQQLGERGVDPRRTPPVRHDHQGAPARGEGGGDGARQLVGPARARAARSTRPGVSLRMPAPPGRRAPGRTASSCRARGPAARAAGRATAWTRPVRSSAGSRAGGRPRGSPRTGRRPHARAPASAGRARARARRHRRARRAPRRSRSRHAARRGSRRSDRRPRAVRRAPGAPRRRSARAPAPPAARRRRAPRARRSRSTGRGAARLC